MERGGPDAAAGAQVGERKRLFGFGERRRDASSSEGVLTATGLARSTASRARAGPFWTSSTTSGRDDGAARCSAVNVSASPSRRR